MRYLVYEAGWGEWEEGAGVEIYEEGDRLFLHEFGTCFLRVPCSWDEEKEISWEEAMEIVEEWEEHYDG